MALVLHLASGSCWSWINRKLCTNNIIRGIITSMIQVIYIYVSICLSVYLYLCVCLSVYLYLYLFTNKNSLDILIGHIVSKVVLCKRVKAKVHAPKTVEKQLSVFLLKFLQMLSISHLFWSSSSFPGATSKLTNGLPLIAFSLSSSSSSSSRFL